MSSKYRLINNIKRYCEGPPKIASSAKWISRCSMISKKHGGNILSKRKRVIETRYWSISMSPIWRSFEKIPLKKLLKFNQWLKYIHWKSWLFNPWILCFLRSTQLGIFEAYPSVNFTFLTLVRGCLFGF